MGGSHKDTDPCQACDAPAGGPSAFPVIPSDVYSVPVLVSGKKTGQVRMMKTSVCNAGVDMGIAAVFLKAEVEECVFSPDNNKHFDSIYLISVT